MSDTDMVRAAALIRAGERRVLTPVEQFELMRLMDVIRVGRRGRVAASPSPAEVEVRRAYRAARAGQMEYRSASGRDTKPGVSR